MLSIQQVTKKIEDKSLLDNVSFDVPKGSSIGLIGPNGAGKSTLMKLISLMKSLRWKHYFSRSRRPALECKKTGAKDCCIDTRRTSRLSY